MWKRISQLFARKKPHVEPDTTYLQSSQEYAKRWQEVSLSKKQEMAKSYFRKGGHKKELLAMLEDKVSSGFSALQEKRNAYFDQYLSLADDFLDVADQLKKVQASSDALKQDIADLQASWAYQREAVEKHSHALFVRHLQEEEAIIVQAKAHAQALADDVAQLQHVVRERLNA